MTEKKFKITGFFKSRSEVTTFGKKFWHLATIQVDVPNPRGVDTLSFRLFGDERIASTDALKPGDEVEVSFHISGRAWAKEPDKYRYIVDLEGDSVKLVKKSGAKPVENLEADDPEETTPLPF